MAKKIALRIAAGVPAVDPLRVARMPFGEILQWELAYSESIKNG